MNAVQHFTIREIIQLNLYFDGQIREGLRRKGYEFETDAQLAKFIRSSCSCTTPETHTTTYYVRNVPFLSRSWIAVEEENGTILSTVTYHYL